MNGDLEPKWTEVWDHINMGRVYDISGSRDRAVNEYNLAIRTKDDTQGAQAEAAKSLKNCIRENPNVSSSKPKNKNPHS